MRQAEAFRKWEEGQGNIPTPKEQEEIEQKYMELMASQGKKVVTPAARKPMALRGELGGTEKEKRDNFCKYKTPGASECHKDTWYYYCSKGGRDWTYENGDRVRCDNAASK